MKKILMMLVVGLLSVTGVAHASEPNCAPQEEGVKAAEAAAKGKPDTAKCAELKGKDKRKCEAEAKNLLKKNLAVARKALACCKNPKACK